MYLSTSAHGSQSSPARPRDAHVALLAVPADAAHVPVARHFVTAVLYRWGLVQESCETAELVVAELAANAVQYGGGEVTLRLSHSRETGYLYVAVLDSGHIPRPRLGRDCDPCERGRGMGIVEFVAQWVQIEQRPGGRCVTACISAPASAVRPLPGRAAAGAAVGAEAERTVSAQYCKRA
ncbi:ATP-binding protein [Streptomyces sp. NPDC049597]|uniref:ATP-binding protein n=1 Tax=Streptomyces sp. NPDC049597 TaxID=3155276 RepID=UPI0034496293